MHEFKFDLPKEEILTVPATFCEDDAGFSANFESGLDGASAYQIAVEHGFAGTEQQWLDSLKGEPGTDGFSPSVAVSDIEGGHRVTVTDKDGEKTFDVMDGKDGAPGSSVTVTSVSSSSADGGVNRVFLSDGTILNIRNGSRGHPGEAGAQGPKGPRGERGLTGLRGLPGANGMDGADGHTPEKGVDYFTAADKQEMVDAVIAALPTWEGGGY